MDLFGTILLDGIAFGAVLFIISVGLTITMGLMRIVNLAHGAFAMFGGYAAVYLTRHGFDLMVAALIASVLTGILGGLAEATIYRQIYRKNELAQVLMTMGFTFVVIALATAFFGASVQAVNLPDYLRGSVDVGFRTYSTYRLALIGVGACIALMLWLVLAYTRYGASLRAAVDNPGMARAVGIDVSRLFTLTFVMGCALAGFGGALGAGLLPMEPYYPLRYLVLFLIVVAVGGLGSFEGSIVAALVVGIVDTAGKYLLTGQASFVLYTVILVLLLLRPNGLIPSKGGVH